MQIQMWQKKSGSVNINKNLIQSKHLFIEWLPRILMDWNR